jgi:hypothetical protein
MNIARRIKEFLIYTMMIYTILDSNVFPKKRGIYKIYFTNSESSKFYIGSASGNLGFYGRWKSHISLLKRNVSKNTILQNASNKYGIDNIIFEIIEECDSDILIREQHYIDVLNSYYSGYNARPKSSNNGGLKMKESSKLEIHKKWKKNRDLFTKDVITLYENENKTTREICKILKISRNFLSRIFKENNIIPRKESGLPKKKIFQYKDGIFINEWESINKCSRENMFNTNGIRLVLNGKCIHYKNFYFSYNLLSQEEISKIYREFKINAKSRKYYFIDK